jgi:hypothetical protein
LAIDETRQALSALMRKLAHDTKDAAGFLLARRRNREFRERYLRCRSVDDFYQLSVERNRADATITSDGLGAG